MITKGKVYASSDWHGCWNVASQVLNWLQSEDTLYFIGDAIDRGNDGLKIFDELIADPRVIFMKGNHEEMMAEAIPSLAAEIADINYYGGNGYSLWFRNGGDVTSRPMWDMSQERIYKYKEIIEKMPVELTYNSPNGHSVILEHAGYTPFDFGYRRGHDPLWDREHFYDKWVGPDNIYLVHGHTPTMYLRLQYGYEGMKPLTKTEIQHRYDWWKEENKKIIIPEVIQYCDNHKFCIDMCTIVSGRIALLDLDTFEVVYFDEES